MPVVVGVIWIDWQEGCVVWYDNRMGQRGICETQGMKVKGDEENISRPQQIDDLRSPLARQMHHNDLRSLTHLPLNKMAATLEAGNLKCTFLMEIVEFRFEFHWNLFPGVQLTITNN